jgi:hypothetical protein
LSIYFEEVFVFFPIFIPCIDLQGNENTDSNQEDFAQSIDQVPGYTILREQLLADFSEK